MLAFDFEQEAWQAGFQHVAGVDEAGRGPLAGPVVAAACVLPAELLVEGIDDSKKLTAAKRKELYERLINDPGVDYAIGVVDAFIIDQINILQATLQAMAVAIARLKKRPDYVFVDGNILPSLNIPAKAVIGGDALCLSIAAASIIAKESRDRMMLDYHKVWPLYGFDQHKGYGTKLHMEMVRLHGPCPIHRKSFAPIGGIHVS